jgi:hypothetical protein
VSESDVPIPAGLCPLCGATDAFVEVLHEGHQYYVECVNCRVYRASRRAFRHFQYLREKADAAGLRRLERLSTALKRRGRGAAVELHYDSWQKLADEVSET